MSLELNFVEHSIQHASMGSVTGPVPDFRASSSQQDQDEPPNRPAFCKLLVTLFPFGAVPPIPVPVLPMGFLLLLVAKLDLEPASVSPESPLG